MVLQDWNICASNIAGSLTGKLDQVTDNAARPEKLINLVPETLSKVYLRCLQVALNWPRSQAHCTQCCSLHITASNLPAPSPVYIVSTCTFAVTYGSDRCSAWNPIYKNVPLDTAACSVPLGSIGSKIKMEVRTRIASAVCRPPVAGVILSCTTHKA